MLRAYGQSMDAVGDSPQIPFYLRRALGGPDDLRGYRQCRCLDNDFTFVSVEYRYPLHDIMDAYAFLDEGRVFDTWRDDFNWRGWRYSYGGGIRVWNEEDGLIANFFVAHSEEETRFGLAIGESF